VDFNFDSSAFKHIDLLIKNGSKLIQLTKSFLTNQQNTSSSNLNSSKSTTSKYRLVLFCSVSGERFPFEIWYDDDGQLIKNNVSDEGRDELDEYMKRSVN
jgi:hypothetical protein